MIAAVRSFVRTVRFVITDTFKSRKGYRAAEGEARYWSSTGIRVGGVANTPMDSDVTRKFVAGAPGRPTTEPVRKPPTD